MKLNTALIAILSLIAISKNEHVSRINKTTRRILRGEPVSATKPYMVYLRPTKSNEARNLWICGGVIIHERHVLTSASCIADVTHFFVVSGTHKWVPLDNTENVCVNNALRAVWKCVPKFYDFDGHENDNYRWMANDIAVVKVERNFNFQKRIQGCDFVPKKIAFNNESEELEKPRTIATVAGWGTTSRFLGVKSIRLAYSQRKDFPDSILTEAQNSPDLLEAEVMLISKEKCKKEWKEPHDYIIDNYMICSAGDMEVDLACGDDVECKDISREALTQEEEHDDEITYRRMKSNPASDAPHKYNETRRTRIISGGFCENDHGGPLIVGQGKKAIVIGLMTACHTREVTGECYGPFLYTSVWKYRRLIDCAIGTDIDATCRKLLQASRIHLTETTFNWSHHLHEPAKTEKPEVVIKKTATLKPLVRFRSGYNFTVGVNTKMVLNP